MSDFYSGGWGMLLESCRLFLIRGSGLRVSGCGLWIVDCGLRIAGCGLRVAGCGLRVVAHFMPMIISANRLLQARCHFKHAFISVTLLFQALDHVQPGGAESRHPSCRQAYERQHGKGDESDRRRKLRRANILPDRDVLHGAHNGPAD